MLIRDVRWVQVNVGDLADHEVQDVRLVQLLDPGVELELLEDAADVRRKAFDVADQGLVDVFRVALVTRERPGAAYWACRVRGAGPAGQ